MRFLSPPSAQDVISFNSFAMPADDLTRFLGGADRISSREFAFDCARSQRDSFLWATTPAARAMESEKYMLRPVHVSSAGALRRVMGNTTGTTSYSCEERDSGAAVLRINIGAIMSGTPPHSIVGMPHPHGDQKYRSNISSAPVSAWACHRASPKLRELVFDIDADSLDEDGTLPSARSCGCKGSAICDACWRIIGIWCQTLDMGLCAFGGRESTSWFFSGRRGMHCWAFRPFVFPRGSFGSQECIRVCSMCGRDRQMLRSALVPVDLCNQSSQIFDEDLLSTKGEPKGCGWSDMARLLTNWFVSTEYGRGPHVRAALHALANRGASADARSAERVLVAENPTDEKLIKVVEAAVRASERSESRLRGIISAACSVLMPRIDAKVTDDPSHLIKAPMSLHPSTGCLAVYVPRERLAAFMPCDAPQVVTNTSSAHSAPHFLSADNAQRAFDEFAKTC